MRRPLLPLLALLLPACRGTGPDLPPPELGRFSLVLVEDGPSARGPGIEERAVFDAHRRFLEGEAAAGRLLASGPFGPGSIGARGALVFDLAEPEEATGALARDPAVQAGLLSARALGFVSLAVLRQLPELEQRRVERAGGVGGDSRRYVLVLAGEGAAAIEAVQHPALAPRVLLLGQLGPPMEGGLLALLDLERAWEFDARLRVAGGDPGGWQVHEWFSTPALADLAQAPGAQPPSSSESK
jgi:uncharacterized protein YciI